MAVEWVALGGLAVGALAVVAPVLNSRVERRAAHRNWLRDERMAVYPAVLEDLENVAAGSAGVLNERETALSMRRVALLGGKDVQAAIVVLVAALHPDDREQRQERVPEAMRALLAAMQAEVRDGA